MKRIMLKLSGEALAGSKKTGFDEDTIRVVALQVKQLVDDGKEVGVVIGGGNFWRGRNGKEMEFEMPNVCPVCGGTVVREEGEAAWYCIGIECSARNLQNLVHFASKSGMDIEGLGISVIEQLIEKGYLSNIADIYYLKKEEIASLKKSGNKFAQNLIDAINKSKSNDLERLICAFGIRHIGNKAARIIARRYGNIEGVMNASIESLNLIDTIGGVSAKSVYEFFHQNFVPLPAAVDEDSSLERSASILNFSLRCFAPTWPLAVLSYDTALSVPTHIPAEKPLPINIRCLGNTSPTQKTSQYHQYRSKVADRPQKTVCHKQESDAVPEKIATEIN